MSANIDISGEDWSQGDGAPSSALRWMDCQQVSLVFTRVEARAMAESLTVTGDHPTKVFWMEIMCQAQTHLIRSKVWEKGVTNRAIRDRVARDPPLPEDYQGYRDIIVCPQGLTRRIAESLTIHASWTSVAIRGAAGWKLHHKIATVKGLFHQYFNQKRIGEIVALLNLPSRKSNAP